jgi:hypothetical protein
VATPLSTVSPAASASSVAGADASHDEVGGHLGAVVEHRVREAAAYGAELAHPGAEPEVDAVRHVQIAEDGGHLVADHAAQRQRVGLDHGDRAAVLAGGGRHLQADPAGADDEHLATGAQPFEQHVGLVDGAQVSHVAQLRARHGERAHPGTGGEQQLVVHQPGDPVERHGVRVGVEVSGAAAQH